MRKLYENFHIFHFKKRIVSAETIRGNKVCQIWTLGSKEWYYLNFVTCTYLTLNKGSNTTETPKLKTSNAWGNVCIANAQCSAMKHFFICKTT